MVDHDSSPTGCSYWLYVLLIGCVAVGLAGCGSSEQEGAPGTDPQRAGVPDSMTIERVLRTDDRFSTLRAALDSVGLDSVLTQQGPYTLFAPPDEAFEALPPGTVDALFSEQPSRLRTLLLHHVAQEIIWRDSLSSTSSLMMMSGDTLTVESTGSTIRVGSAEVVDGDIEASNGLLHVIDGVLQPPPAPASTP